MIKKQIRYSILLTNVTDSSSVLEYKGSKIKEGSKLGTGGFGKVIQGFYYSLKVAIKKIKEYNSKALYREIFIMKKFAHPFIPKLYGIILRNINKNYRKKVSKSEKSLKNLVNLIKVNNSLALLKPEIINKEEPILKNVQKSNVEIILELVEGDSLEKLMKTEILTKLEKIVILLNLSTVLEYLHGFNLIHRDLKPENIMIDFKLQTKLLDFGISKLINLNDETKTISAGTMCYMAPENFNLDLIEENEAEEGSQVLQDFNRICSKVDVWAFGCIVHEIFTGVKPWSNKVKTNNKILSILYKKIPFEISHLIKNSKIRNLIEKCVEIVPENRISIKNARILLLEILYDTVKEDLINHCKDSEKLENNGLGKILCLFQSKTKRDKFHLLMKIQMYIFDFLTIMKKNSTLNSFEGQKKSNESKFIDEYVNQVISNQYPFMENFIKEQKILLSKRIDTHNKDFNFIDNKSYDSLEAIIKYPKTVRADFKAHTVMRVSSKKLEFKEENNKSKNGLTKSESFEILGNGKKIENKYLCNREVSLYILNKVNKIKLLFVSKAVNLEISSLKPDKNHTKLPAIKIISLKKNMDKIKKSSYRIGHNNIPFYFNSMNKLSDLSNEERKIIINNKTEEKNRNDNQLSLIVNDIDILESARVNIEENNVLNRHHKVLNNDVSSRIYYTKNIMKSSFYLDTNKSTKQTSKILPRHLRDSNNGIFKNVFLEFDCHNSLTENSPEQNIKNRIRKTAEIKKSEYQ